MRGFKFLVFLATLILVGAPAAYAACIVNISTGYDQAAGEVITPGDPDDDYTVTGPGVDGAALTGGSDQGFPVPIWIDNDDNSLWIAPTANAVAAPGVYTYKIEFEIPEEVDASQLTLVGNWANDDRWDNIKINGTATGMTGGGFGGWQAFPENFGLGLFKTGTNTIEFLVANGGADANPAGLRVEACVASPEETPEERPYNISTGFDEEEKKVLDDGAADANWSVSGPDGSGIDGTPVAVPDGAIPETWWPKTVNSRWIGPDTADSVGPAGEYVYTVTVTLPDVGMEIERAIMKGGFTADSVVTDVVVNGQSTGLTSSDPGSLTIFPVDAGQTFFKAGENAIQFVVQKSEEGTTGLRVDAQIVEGNPPVKPPASVLTLDTGFDNEAGATIENSQPDDNWIILGPAGSDLGPEMATVVPDNAFPIGPWMGSTERSKWIGPNAVSANGPGGVYTYRIFVEVPEELDASTLKIIGSLTSDNAGVDVRINGVSTGFTWEGNFTTFQPFPDNFGLGLFQTGINKVEILVNNEGFGPTGLRVEAVVGPGGVGPDIVVTGLDSRSGLPLPAGAEDPVFTVTTPEGGDPQPAVVISGDGVDTRGWLSNSLHSQWIGLDGGDSEGAAGTYTYTFTFNLPGQLVPSRVELTGSWTAAQGGGDVLVNGTSLGLAASDPGAFTEFPAGSGKGLFVAGTNTITFVVENSEAGSTGLRVEAKVVVVPEPNPLDISTGFDEETGEIIASDAADDDYVVKVPDESENPALALGAIPSPPWVLNTATSRWIGAEGGGGAGALGDYVYKITVELPEGAKPETAYIKGVWAADDGGNDILINGTSTGAGTAAGFVAWTAFPENFGLGLFRAGTNTIEFLVSNGGDDPNPTGLRVEAEVVVEIETGTPFKRGDANADGALDIADAIFVLGFLFAQDEAPPCKDAADANDDEALDIADAISILGHLFGGTGPLPEPFEECGIDPTETEEGLDCGSFDPCAGGGK